MLSKNLLTYLLKKYPNREWSYDNVLKNPNITIEFIEKYAKGRQFNTLLNDKVIHNSNSNLLLEIIEKYPKKKFLYNFLTNNLTQESIEKHIDKPLPFKKLLYNKCSNLELVKKYPDKDWNWNCQDLSWKMDISSNPELTIEMLEKFPNKPWNWGYGGISFNPALTIEMLEKFPDKPWRFNKHGISSNSALTLEMLEKFPDKDWNWGKYAISYYMSITLEILEKFSDKDWYFGMCGLSSNKSLTIEMIEAFPNKHWCFETISFNPALTIEMLEKFPNKSWWWDGIVDNPSIKIEMFEKISDKSWTFSKKPCYLIKTSVNMISKIFNKFPNKIFNWFFISCNPNITKKFIETYIDKIDFNALSSNTFTYHNKIIIEISKKIKLFYYLSFAKVIYDIKRYITVF